MKHLTLAAMLTLTAGYAVHADEPTPAPAATDIVAPQVAVDEKVAQEKAAADQAAKEKAEKDKVAQQSNNVKQLRAAGYKPVTKNGETLWCREEQALGSRFPKTTCNSMDGILANTRNGQELAEEVRTSALRSRALN